VTDDQITKESIEAEFPGWEAWQGVDWLWHARIRGATPAVMVHGEDLVDLRDQVKRKISQLEEAAYQQDQR
jgi:broad specificity phosphatase PhoE